MSFFHLVKWGLCAVWLLFLALQSAELSPEEQQLFDSIMEHQGSPTNISDTIDDEGEEWKGGNDNETD